VGFFKRLLGREDESADPFGQPAEASIQVAPTTSAAPSGTSVSTPLMSFQSTPVEASWSTVMVNGKSLPPDQAQAFTSAFEQLGNLASMGTSQVVDLRNVPGLRDKVLGAMRDHADDAAALQGAVLEALQSASEQLPEPAAGAAAPRPAKTGDPVERLKKLDELRDQGVLTDAEFDAQKQKLLDEL
jgi:Short C-terminal domain